MLPNRETLLCRYHYDPLDRLVDWTPSAQAIARRFYLKDRLATEIQGALQRSIMQHDDLLLAQQQGQSGALETRLLATDQQRSVLYVLDATRLNSLAYPPYGHRPVENGLLSLLCFNGERPDPVTGCYLLGNGYRAFNPVLMRFNSPDSWSPFGEGGLNAYVYCVGDPVNKVDKNGHIPNLLKPTLRQLGWIKKTIAAKPSIETLVPPISIQSKNDIYTFVGFHGTSDEFAKTMQITGPKPEFDTKPNLSYGPGFYTTPNITIAQRYADNLATEMFARNPDGVLATYLKNPSEKVLNKDYRFIPEYEELVLKKHIYKDVILVRFKGANRIAKPDINKIFNIRQPANSTRTHS
ncbi:RHS repeat-associated core domain-containing protein [Pseudomonas sp. SDO5591_S426]